MKLSMYVEYEFENVYLCKYWALQFHLWLEAKVTEKRYPGRIVCLEEASGIRATLAFNDVN